ncbi:hypothetical protein Tco_0266339 [Tanacetum coccineum]
MLFGGFECCIPQRRSTWLTPPTPILTTAEADDIILQDIIQLILVDQKSHDEIEAKQNVQKVEEHLIDGEIEKLVEGAENVENVEANSSTLRKDDTQNIPNIRLEPRSNKESLEVEITVEVQPVNINEEEEESAEDDYELKRRGKGKHVEESRSVAKMIADAIQQERENLRAEISLQITNAITNHIPSQVDLSVQNYMLGHILHLQQDDLPIWLALKYKFERLHVSDTPYRPLVVRPRDQDDPHDDAHHEGDNSAKRQKTSKHGTYVFGESSSGQDYKSEPGSYVIDDDEIPTEKVSQELVNEMSQTVDEAKLRKVTYWELGHEHKFITEIVARRENGSIVSIIESDYKNLNKNDIKDMYLLIVKNKVNDYAETGLLWSLSVFFRSIVIWERVHDFQLGVESCQQKVNLTAPTITFPGIEKYKVFFIISELVYDIIYKNNKKEKRVMRHQEVHKLCDATLKRFLEGLKSYNNDVKHGYVTPSLSKEDVEYLQLFEEEIEQRFKHSDQIRRWEMYVNARPLGSRRERPE